MTRLARFSLCCAALAVPATAQDMSEGEAQILPRLIESACVDLVEERIGCEQVMLLASDVDPDRADLIILSDWRDDPASEPLLIARSVAFNGSMWGMAPSLEATESGSLRLRSEQTGIGRFPWSQTMTIAYRDERFILAGFTYATYDRAAGGDMSCDINMLTGDYVIEATRVNPETEATEQALYETGQIAPMDIDAALLGTNAPFPPPCEAAVAALDGY